MRERPQPDPVPADDPPPHPAEPLQIDTPVIDMQDLEHQTGPATRDFAREDEDALHAIEEVEKLLRGQLHG